LLVRGQRRGLALDFFDFSAEGHFVVGSARRLQGPRPPIKLCAAAIEFG
jgi:hypothetical protein